MPFHRALRAAALPAAVLAASVALTACSHSSPSASGGSATSGATSTSPTSTPAAQAAPLAAALRHGLAGVTSAHLDVRASGLLGTAVGSIEVRRGTVTASDLVLTTGGSKARVITVGSTSYAHLDGGRQLSGKPWVRVSSTSTNEFVRGLAGNLQLVRSVTSLGEVADLFGTATSVTPAGSATVDGVRTTHDKVILDSAAQGSGGRLQGLFGSGSVPIDLWTDAQHRPVRVVAHLRLGGSTLAVTVDITKYDVPVTITAPPADLVSG